MAELLEPARHETAILFADIQASSALARRLSTQRWFELIREFSTFADEMVVENTGIVGRHAGDGLTAFFLAEQVGSRAAACAAALHAGPRDRRAGARRSSPTASCTSTPGVHWGGALYLGQVVTGGRLEVTALGDEVNECARIQQSARDGIAARLQAGGRAARPRRRARARARPADGHVPHRRRAAGRHAEGRRATPAACPSWAGRRGAPPRSTPQRGRWRSGSSPAPAPTRCPGSRAAAGAGARPSGATRYVSRGRVRRGRRPARLAPRRGPRAALQPRHAPREHRRARSSSARRGCSRSRSAARSIPAVELGSLICFDDLHFLANRLADGRCARSTQQAGDTATRALDLRGPVLAGAARGAAGGRADAGVDDARRRLLRARRRAALQHEGGDPRARGRGRDGGVADRRAGDRAGGRGASCRSRWSATRPTTPTASSPRPTPVERLLELIAASTETFARVLAAAVPRIDEPALAPAGIVYRFHSD